MTSNFDYINAGNLYRAKMDNGEWVEGFLVSLYGNFYIYTDAEVRYEVNRHTIGQYTGQEYLSGERAYSGDLFRSTLNGLVMELKYGTYIAWCPEDKAFMENVGFYAEAEGYMQMPIGNLEEYAVKIGNVYDGSF